MKNKKDILIATGAGVLLAATALLIYMAPVLAGGSTTGVRGASGCKVTNAQGQVSCPMANNQAQDANEAPTTSSGSCH